VSDDVRYERFGYSDDEPFPLRQVSGPDADPPLATEGEEREMADKKRVRNVGKVNKLRGSDDLSTVGFEVEPDIARKLAVGLIEAAESGAPTYVWADKNRGRVYLTVEDRVEA
jgi:hypothetical protein